MTYKRNEKEKEALNRRQFLGKMAVGAVAATGAGALTYLSYSDDPVRRKPPKIYSLPDYQVDPGGVYPQMVVARGKDAYKMVKAAVDKLGGAQKFISPGDRVVIKPNVAWDRLPEQAANTSPEVVEAVVKLAVEARAGSVTVTDVSLNDPFRCFARSGIEKAAQDAGAKIWIPGQNDYKLTDLKGSLLKVWPVSEIFLDADKVINIPTVKHHSLCRATLAQKNWYGILGGRRNQLHQDIHTSIADLAQAVRPTLTVMDATRTLMRNGPTGGSLNDVKQTNAIIAGLDEVAIDAYSLTILGASPDEIAYMAMSQQRGLGVIDWKSIRFEEISV